MNVATATVSASDYGIASEQSEGGIPRATYGDLENFGPSVTVDTTDVGNFAMAMVYVTCEMEMIGADELVGRMSFEVNGPDSYNLQPSDTRAFAGNVTSSIGEGNVTPQTRATVLSVIQLGTAGSYTFDAKYKASLWRNASEGEGVIFRYRDITVTVLPGIPPTPPPEGSSSTRKAKKP